MNPPVLNNHQKINAFIGLQKGNIIEIKMVVFTHMVESYDDILAWITLRGRSLVKSAFQADPRDPEYKNIMQRMSLKGFYELTTNNHKILDRNLYTELPNQSIIFFLDSTTNWKVLSKVTDLNISTPTDIESIYREYYTNHYPPEVVKHAFSKPKIAKRVYSASESKDAEVFYFEPILFESDELEMLVVTTTPQ